MCTRPQLLAIVSAPSKQRLLIVCQGIRNSNAFYAIGELRREKTQYIKQ